jgi:penicillin-binding protein 1B
MGEAARYYFGRNVEDLTLAESATLAGMIRAPNAYSPLRQPEACLERRNGVLKRMADLRWIGPAEYEAARTAPLQLPARTPPLKCAPYFVDYLRQQLHELYDPEMLASEGLTVYTTLNPEVSAAAETALSEGVAALERNHPQLLRGGDDNPLQAAMVVLHPKTGAILALVGGRDYDTSSFNRALFARRQPGSAIKPFVYLAALEEFTTASWLPDDPVSYLVSGKSWSPRNFDGRYRGQVTLRRALEESLNAATVQLALTVGLERVIGTLRAMGITAPMAPVPSLALGSLEVTPIELAKAYATLANEGQEPYLLTLREVATAAGDVLERRQVGFETVTSAAKAYIVNSMLQGVMQRGTGKVARSWGIDFPCAGKTGTTNNQQDSWFAGFTTDLLALVWVGYDDNRPTPFTGASGALRIWSHFFRRVRPLIHPQPFRVPPGIVERYVCPESGFLANPACPDKEKEAFLSDKVPRQSCGLHTP